MIRRADRFHGDPLSHARQGMIRQTDAFLTWALQQPRVPRIPARRVDEGGFSYLADEPQARALVASWWMNVLGDGWFEV